MYSGERFTKIKVSSISFLPQSPGRRPNELMGWRSVRPSIVHQLFL